MITFAGVGLTPPSDAQDSVNQFWHGHRFEEFDESFYTGGAGLDHLPISAQRPTGPPRIGVLSWPTSASRWAVCHLVASGDQLTMIRTALGSTPSAQPLIFDDGNHTPVTCSMWMLPPRPISQRGDGKEQYLLTLVDDRWWWWQQGDQATPTNPTSWAGLLTSLLSSIGITTTLPTIPSGYSVPTVARWNLGYKPIPPLIDAATRTVGVRVTRGLDGTIQCVNAVQAAADDETQWTTFKYEVLSGGRTLAADMASSIPSSVSVEFLPASTKKVTLTSLALAEYAGRNGATGRSASITADLPATAADADQQSYATQAATDYYRWALSRTECVIRGLVARPTTGMDDRIEWVHPASGEMVTRVFPLPFSDRNQYGTTQAGAITVQDEGVALPQQPAINFVGAGVTASDDPTHQRTIVTIPGTTLQAGRSDIPVAESAILSSFNVWGDTDIVIHLPSAGTYLLNLFATTYENVTGAVAWLSRLYDRTNGVPVANNIDGVTTNPALSYEFTSSITSGNTYRTRNFNVLYTTTQACDLVLQFNGFTFLGSDSCLLCYRYPALGTAPQLVGEYTYMNWVKLF